MEISSTEIVVLLVGASMWLIGRRAAQKQKKSTGRARVTPAGKSPRDRQAANSELTRRLKQACFGDRLKADRLIQYEKKRAPGITHAEAIQRALERLEIDRGRHN
ncbi:hypothetical protein ACIPF8_17475 [Collimonas sp. NPDC087041]|uniref:hypothetical protein n=1 Tax=Collimonas sp. NPDC087041 TaxID=3363960 RepID=UPI0038107F41